MLLLPRFLLERLGPLDLLLYFYDFVEGVTMRQMNRTYRELRVNALNTSLDNR